METKIPNQLQNEEFRFIRLKGKIPQSKNWVEVNCKFNDENLNLHLKRGGNYGVVMGFGDLIVIDCDSKEVEEATKNMPETFTVRTGSGMLHRYYLCPEIKEPIRMVSKGKATGEIGDILAYGKQAVGPNSIHPNGVQYKVESDKPIAIISKEEVLFTLRNYIKKSSEDTKKEEDTLSNIEINLSDVLNTAGLKQHGNEWYGPHPIHGSSGKMNFWANMSKGVWHCFRCNSGGGPLYWLAVSEGILDCSESRSGALRGDKFKQVLKVLEKKYNIKINNPKKKKSKNGKEEGPEIEETSFYLDGDNIYEEICDENNLCKFLYLNDGMPKVVNEIEVGDKIIKPIKNDAVLTGAVKLPTGAEEYGTTQDLIKDIREHLHKYLDIDSQYENFASWYVLLSWVYDKFRTLNYLRALGDTGTGKSRFLNVIGGLCYKPMKIGGAVTPAPIYRMIRVWQGSLIIDEADFKESDEKNEVVTILNCGFEKNNPIVRCDKDDPNNLLFFDPFGPKIMSTRQRFRDKALESRCLTHTMGETNRKDIPDTLLEDFYEEQRVLRNKLLMFRLKNYNKIEPSKVKQINLGDVEPRLKQATRSFALLFANIPGMLKTFREFLYDYNIEIREQRAESYEGALVNLIAEFICEGNIDLSASDILQKVKEDIHDKATARSIGRKLKVIGFNVKVKRFGPTTKKVIDFGSDKKAIAKIFKRYIPDPELYEKVLRLLDNVTFVTEHRGCPLEFGGRDD